MWNDKVKLNKLYLLEMVKRFLISVFVTLAFFMWQFHDLSPHRHHSGAHWSQIDDHYPLGNHGEDERSPFDGFNHQEDFEKSVIQGKMFLEFTKYQELSDIYIGYYNRIGIVDKVFLISQFSSAADNYNICKSPLLSLLEDRGPPFLG